MATQYIVIKSSDHRSFRVRMEVGNMFPDFVRNNEENQLVITLNFVTGDILEKVLEWVEHQCLKLQVNMFVS